MSEFLDLISLLYSEEKVSFFKTIYFNYRLLSGKSAKKIPIVIYDNVQLLSLSGKIVFSDCDVRSCMINIGLFNGYRSQGRTRLNIKGTVIFHGCGTFLKGSELVLYKTSSVLELGDNFWIGENSMIYCVKYIKMGRFCRLNYQSQIMDSDFHYMINVNSSVIKPIDRDVVLGDYNWFANKTTIKKGTKTPNYLTVAGSYAVLCRDYTKEFAPYTVVGSAGLQVLASGMTRIFKDERNYINRLDEFFLSNPTSKYYKLQENESLDDFIY